MRAREKRERNRDRQRQRERYRDMQISNINKRTTTGKRAKHKQKVKKDLKSAALERSVVKTSLEFKLGRHDLTKPPVQNICRRKSSQDLKIRYIMSYKVV